MRFQTMHAIYMYMYIAFNSLYEILDGRHTSISVFFITFNSLYEIHMAQEIEIQEIINFQFSL